MPVTKGDTGVSGYMAGDFLAARVYQGDELVYEAAPLKLTVAQQIFEPWLILAAGSTAVVNWYDDEDALLATGLRPVIDLGSAGPHTVTMRCTRPWEVISLNLGFHDNQDSGLYHASYFHRHVTQGVTAIENLQTLSGLQQFFAARVGNASTGTPGVYNGPLLAGHLNFAGMQDLVYIECFESNVQSVNLTGCTSLIRLCLEGCNMDSLDLNPVRNNLKDIRAARQQDGTLNFIDLTGPMTQLYHLCIRSQIVTGLGEGSEAMFPVIEQYWNWDNGYNRDVIKIQSAATNGIDSVHLDRYGFGPGTGVTNIVRHLDVSDTTWGSLDGTPSSSSFGNQSLAAPRVQMQTINLDNITNPPVQVYLDQNLFDEATVDYVLATVESWGTSGGELRLGGDYLLGQNVPPSAAGLADVALLRGRGWTVTHAVGTGPGDLIVADEFDRVDATGWAAVGNNWQQPVGGSDISIVGGKLVISGGSSYQRVIWTPPQLVGITSYDIEIEFEAEDATEWFGVLVNVPVGGATGGKVLFTSNPMSLPRGDAASSSSGREFTSQGDGVPATWRDPGVHKMRLRKSTGSVRLFLDDQLAGLLNQGINYGNSNFGVGFCGTPGKTYRAIRVYETPSGA